MTDAPWCKVAIAVAVISGCGGSPKPPARGVIEAAVGDWDFRRFQGPLFDVEVNVEGNHGVAYSASYVTKDAEATGHVTDRDVCSAIVTKFDRDDGVTRATIVLARKLAAAGGYEVDEDKVSGTRALKIIGADETWVMWPARGYVVKIGGRGRTDVPGEVVAGYAKRYPSLLAGGALEGPLPPAAGGGDGSGGGSGSAAPKREYDPNNPQPDFEKVDPSKMKMPGHGSGAGAGGSGS